MSTAQLHWFKSSYSDTDDVNDCGEVATTPATIHIRDSKTPEVPHVTVTPSTWTDFLTYVAK
ncbi:DUF397 domain-containing protein [Streptomyces sp. KR55]|uniref:DUF397 domain-containing protein n=1 Tax=Streptomyces sp. KR55 TaxID=3457425 RepID=UPI003FD23BBA